jgi:heterodisulfide reductase subunit C
MTEGTEQSEQPQQTQQTQQPEPAGQSQPAAQPQPAAAPEQPKACDGATAGESTGPVTPDPEFTKMLVEKGAKTLNLCFQCGTCTGSCASGRFTAFRTRKVVRRAQLGLKDQILPCDDLWMCTTCYTCFERCPRGVEIPDIIFLLRNLAVQSGYMGDAHKKVAGLLVKTGHMVPLSEEYQKVREKMGLSSKPTTVMTNEKAKADFDKLIKFCKFDKLIGMGGD